MIVINAMKKTLEECHREIKVWVEDCKYLFSYFNSLVFKHIRRNKYKAAHVIAKNGIECLKSVKWLVNHLIWLQTILHENIRA